MPSGLDIDQLVATLISKGILSEKDVHNKTEVPIGIFRGDAAPLESICIYAKGELGRSEKEIAFILDKPISTIKAALKSKGVKHLGDSDSVSYKIPLNEFSNSHLSVLEILVVFLQRKGLGYTEIGDILFRDVRTIWTIAKRAEKKEVLHG